MHRLLVILIAATVALGSAAEAGEIVIATDRGADVWWPTFAVELAQKTGQPVRLGGNDLWPGSPSARDTAQARGVFDDGVQSFLALDLGTAASQFNDAHGQYSQILDGFPFDEGTYDQVLRSGFYAAWSYLQDRKRRQGRECLRVLLTRFPDAAPDAKIFPPPFLSEVEDARRKLERKVAVAEVTVSVTPPTALVSIDGRVSLGAAGVHRLLVGEGAHRLGVGIPGVAVTWQELRGGEPQQLEVDLTAWPTGTPRPLTGGPAGPKTINAYRAGHGVTHLAWITSGERLAKDDSVIWVHDVRAGSVTAVIVVPRSAGPDVGSVAASAVADALRTDDLEILVIDEGAARRDTELSTRVEAVLSDDAISAGIELEPVVPDNSAPGETSIRLGASLATGLGVATEVTDPGVAPTPLVGRLSVSWRATSSVDLGLGGRFQLVDPAALGEAFVRVRWPNVYLRGGVGVGRITHKILETENRTQSSSELVGPLVGLEIPLGPVEIGLHVHAPLFPDTTVHADLSLGLGLDL